VYVPPALSPKFETQLIDYPMLFNSSLLFLTLFTESFFVVAMIKAFVVVLKLFIYLFCFVPREKNPSVLKYSPEFCFDISVIRIPGCLFRGWHSGGQGMAAIYIAPFVIV